MSTLTDVTQNDFKNNITKGLVGVFTQAFQTAYRILVQTKVINSRLVQPPTEANLSVNISSINSMGDFSPDGTKKNVQIIYCLLNNNAIVPVEYAHDSINLLSDQEVASILQYQIVEKAYMEKEPRVTAVQDQRLWIIGAVLGPIALLILIFWLTGFLYYKCISPRSAKKNQKVDVAKAIPAIPANLTQVYF